MAAPKKVKERAALAEKLIAQSVNTPVDGNLAAAPLAPKPELSVVTDPVVAAAPPQQNPYAIVPNAPQIVGAPSEPVTEDWRHKYSVLKGMFDKSRSDDATRISQLENQIGVLTTMAQHPTTIQDTFHPEIPAQGLNYGLTEEQIEEVGGQEFVDYIGQISSAGAADEIASLRREIGTLQDSQKETLEDIFYSRLTELSTNWRVINADERFDLWLKEGEGLSGIARSNFLTNAFDNRDADTVARYFNQFAELLPTEPGLNPDVITDFIPDTTGGGGPSQSRSGAVYTPASIQQFFKDKGLGKWKGKEDEAAAIERDIFAAQKEGRIMLAGGRRSA